MYDVYSIPSVSHEMRHFKIMDYIFYLDDMAARYHAINYYCTHAGIASSY